MNIPSTPPNWIAVFIVCFGICLYGGPLVERLGERFGRWLSRKLDE